MTKPAGYSGATLVIDLTAGKVETRLLDGDMARKFVGGLGAMIRLAWDEIRPGTDPLSPDNPIIIGAGPLVGTNAPGSSRVFCLTKMPANNAIGWGGGGGMKFGAALKYTGYDNVIVKGKSDRPVYIFIDDDTVEIRDASALKGKGAKETSDHLYGIHGRSVGVMAIGQAGENLVPCSMAFIDKCATIGRGGVGAVFGSKNLKTVVVRGTGGVEVADRKRFRKAVDGLFERVKKYPALAECHEMGFLKNMPVMPRDFYLDKVKKARRACIGCPIGDKDVLAIREGRFAGLECYATSAINTVLPFVYGIRDYYEAISLLDTMDEYGLDMFEAFALIKLADNLHRAGVVSSSEFGSEGIDFDHDSIAEWLRRIAFREGFGDVIADGFAAVMERYGPETAKLLPGVSKNMTTYFGIRGPLFWERFGTMEFGMAVHMRGPAAAPGGSTPLYNTRGADIEWIKSHLKRIGVPDNAMARILDGSRGMKINVGRLTKYGQESFYSSASLGTCVRAHINRFYSNAVHAELFSAATGIEKSGAELLECAERAYNLLRVMNAREGFSRHDDRFPDNWFDEPLHFDYYGDVKITRDVAEGLLDDYYDERGWDVETGLPTPEKLRSLGLEFAASRGEK